MKNKKREYKRQTSEGGREINLTLTPQLPLPTPPTSLPLKHTTSLCPPSPNPFFNLTVKVRPLWKPNIRGN